ncbi:hypothetical protein MesoLjLc_51970 [Mesorhizobium sp. L-8-10]|uniref:hypothetical protein n=1 Tax=Mesorhizobium sp. L-8-10 TaxID=2744523 RepID=UPI001926175E|nr:hypothetical protein [Mesorhizobium sp. L-8-10]BCH33267.1 hypothetical protein MesoLjLc_51970 [Mesorhizobium sp. L-8-10]
MTDLQTLLADVENLAGPDRNVDVKLGALWPEPRPFNLRGTAVRNGRPPCLHFTGSIDAARLLLKHVLPGWIYRVAECSVSDDAWVIPDFNDPVHGAALQARFQKEAKLDPVEFFGTDVDRRPAGQPALALIEALLLALIFISSPVENGDNLS